MNDKIKMVALMGKAGSGKDSILKKIIEKCPNAKSIIGYTTRPMREGEKDGVNYYYISEEEFTKQLLANNLLECTSFNGWFYGTGLNQLDKDKINIGIFDPDGVEALLFNPNIDIQVYYITASDKQRLLRQLNREDSPDCLEICRRFKTDWLDFDAIEEDIPCQILFNETLKDFDDCIKIIKEKIDYLDTSI